MSCKMNIHILVTVPDRAAGRRLENELAQAVYGMTGAEVDVSYHYSTEGEAILHDCNISTCGGAPEKVTGVPHDGDEKPILLGEDAGDIAHGWGGWFPCRSRHLHQRWATRQHGVDDASVTGEVGLALCSDLDCVDLEPCPDAGSGPHCAACPHSSVSPPASGSGPVAGS